MKEKKQRVIVKGIVERDGKVLLVRRKREGHEVNGKWELPGGKIEFGEKMEDACVREIWEETRTIVTFNRIDIANYHNVFFDGIHYSHLILIPVICSFVKTETPVKQDKNVYEIRWFEKNAIKELDVIEGTLEVLRGVLQ